MVVTILALLLVLWFLLGEIRVWFLSCSGLRFLIRRLI